MFLYLTYIAAQGRIPYSKEDAEKTKMEYASRGTYGYSPDGYKLINLTR